MNRAIATFAALLATACQTALPVAAPSKPLDDRDLPVLEAVITEIGTSYLQRVPEKLMLLETTTRAGSWDGSTGGAVQYGAPSEGWPEDVTRPLEARNESTYNLDRLEPIPQRVELVSREIVRSALGRRSSWPRFSKRFPQAFGVASVSAPGFADNGSRAGVVVSVYCGVLCGWGELLLLEPSENGWIITKRYSLWES